MVSCKICKHDIDRSCPDEDVHICGGAAFAMKMVEVLDIVCVPCLVESGIDANPISDPSSIDVLLSKFMVKYIESRRYKRGRKRKVVEGNLDGSSLQRLCLIDLFITHAVTDDFKYIDLAKSARDLWSYIEDDGFNVFYKPAAVLRKLRRRYGIKGRICFWPHPPRSPNFSVRVFGTDKRHVDAYMKKPMECYYDLKGRLEDHQDNLAVYGEPRSNNKFLRWEHELAQRDFFSVPISQRIKIFKRANKMGVTGDAKDRAEHCRDLQKQAREKGF